MSYINVTNIQVVNNPSTFRDPLCFKITFECLKDIPEEIEWKILYIGSSKDVKYDQVLDSFSMGPLEYGVMQFDLESDAPDSSQIPQHEILGVTAIILSVSYRGQEFFRVGYYVYNFYSDPELNDNPPEEVQIDKITRNILHDKPRITRFDIKWGDEKEEENPESTDVNSHEVSGQENEASYIEKMHLFMNDGDLSASFSHTHSQNPFMTGGEVQSHSHLSNNILHETSGLGIFAGGDSGMETEKQANPFF